MVGKWDYFFVCTLEFYDFILFFKICLFELYWLYLTLQCLMSSHFCFYLLSFIIIITGTSLVNLSCSVSHQCQDADSPTSIPVQGLHQCCLEEVLVWLSDVWIPLFRIFSFSRLPPQSFLLFSCGIFMYNHYVYFTNPMALCIK